MNPLDVKCSQHLHNFALPTSHPQFIELQLLRSIPFRGTKSVLKNIFAETNGEIPETLSQIANAKFKDGSCKPLIIFFVKKCNKTYTLMKVLSKCVSSGPKPNIFFAIMKQQEFGDDDSLKITKIKTAVKKGFRTSLSWKTIKMYFNSRIITQHKLCFH